MADPLPGGLERLLKSVKKGSLTTKVCEEIVKVLDNDTKPELIQQLLEICIQDPKDDLKYATKTLNILSVILKKVTEGDFTSKPDLLPSMLEILHMIKTSIYSCTSNKIKVLYFKILISYPDEVFLQLEEDSEVVELFNLYSHQRIPAELRVQPINVLHKYLKALPPDKRFKFVEQGINIWLLRLVPNVMLFVTIPDFDIETSIATLEMIANELRYIDYYDNPNWQSILKCFYEPEKYRYPSIMKDLLMEESNIWHRLWMVFIKILKDQLTKSSSFGSPINSMLPVVETAFKMDVTNRCRAFECWNVLIDNFSTESNEAYVNKRMKLLVIPLYSNNAKIEEVVIVKINTWWHLICSYSLKLKNFDEIILSPFLQFCFGKLNSSKPVIVPGLLTNKTKERCVEAFVNILGHHDCDGCVSLPPLKDKVMNEKYLIPNRKDLIYCLDAAIKTVSNNPSKLRKPFRCAWICFIKLICEVSDNDVRGDVFDDLLVMIKSLIQDYYTEALADIVLEDLILILFEMDDEIIKCLNTVDEPNSPFHNILSIILNPSFDTIYKRYDMIKAVEIFKAFANFTVKHPSIIESLLKKLLTDYKSLVLWSAITSSICKKKTANNEKIQHELLLWPLKHLDVFVEVEFSTSLWLKLFGEVGTLSIKNEILGVFNESGNIDAEKSLFILNVAIMILSQKIAADKGIDYEEEMELVHDVTNKIHDLNYRHPVFSKLTELICAILKKLLKDINLNIAKHLLMTFKFVLKLLSEFEEPTEFDVFMKFEEVLKSINELLKLETYAPLKHIILTDFIEYAQCLGQHQSLKNIILTTLQMFLNSFDTNNPIANTIKNSINSLEQNLNSEIDKPKFTTPATKKAKKKDTSIVNKVVEDGEEFVVVKSNWKFNPKKLTDNQKEKLERKREDIPALYQDLSQSQDEFKLKTWKTDSQDTTTNSKSIDLNSEPVTSIIKNMPNTDVVPKILKNILIESIEKKNNINELQSPINKETKPKLALKDRVFRNVKNLIEKSNVKNGETHVKSPIADIRLGSQTPTGMSIKAAESILNSAPSEINADRPSRVKRKPKKFEEMQIFDIKKKRQSNSDSQKKDSFEDLNQNRHDTENSDAHDITLNALDVISKNVESHIMQDTSLPNEELKHGKNDAQSDDIDHVKFSQDENVDDPEHSKTNLVETGPEIVTDNNIAVDNVIDKGIKNINDHLGTKEDNSIQSPLNKKTGKKKSRIEKELAIDMVEGHPFLKVQSEKRLTRKKASESPVTSRRKSLTQKLTKSKIDQKNTPKVDRKVNEVETLLDKSKEFDTFANSQDSSIHDENGSQDIIESSQDSTISIMSVKSSKTVKRIPFVKLQNIECKAIRDKPTQSGKSLSGDSKIVKDLVISDCENKDDSEFPLNQTAVEDVQIELTENMDTQPIENISCNEGIVIGDNVESGIGNNMVKIYVDIDTLDIADADTQPIDPNTITKVEVDIDTQAEETESFVAEENHVHITDTSRDTPKVPTQDESTISPMESSLSISESKQDESLSKLVTEDEEQRKQDFLNNTLEISPIKTLSPVRENKSPSPETSGDYVVIKLSSPVQSNGEPYEMCDSPEVFTEEKVSPDKRDQSPPRQETRVNTASPRSLSLKKNKPQVRSGGRAAQMLGLCVPSSDRLQTILNSDKAVEAEEPKKCSPLNSSARRNLRILYNSTSESSETTEENDETQSFLRMKRSLPPSGCSPSVPILKRKLGDIADDTTVSPASKRKRVSFHDPPVSTTICVKKYIEPSVLRSPQNSATKRQERQLRSQGSGNFKSLKRLDTVFKLDTALTKAVESFNEGDVTPSATEDTEMSPLEPTPIVEVVKNSELNDIDPICIDLINCMDPVDNIAGNLSSPALRPLLVKEFVGKIETVGDLAKMTELEVNRLCIKAPKVQVAKKVLMEYAKKINIVGNEMTPMTEEKFSEPTNANDITPRTEAAFSEFTVVEPKVVDIEMQTDCVTIESVEVQTESSATSIASTQTNRVTTVDCEIQTDESGTKSSRDITISLLEEPDFCEHLNELLDMPSKQRIATSVPLNELTDILLKDVTFKESSDIIDRMLEKHTSNSQNGRNENLRLSFMQEYLSKSFSSKDLILLCSDLLKKVHDGSI